MLGRSSGDPAGNRDRVPRCLPAKGRDRTQLQQRAGKVVQGHHQQKQGTQTKVILRLRPCIFVQRVLRISIFSLLFIIDVFTTAL